MSQRRRLGSVTGSGTLLALGAAILAGRASVAGDAPPACAAWMDSNIVAFAEGDPVKRIIGFTDSSATCTDVDGDLEPELSGDVYVEFGPYAVVGCSDPDAIVVITLTAEELREGTGQGGEASYVPVVPTHVFHAVLQGTVLRTNCVSATNLDYRIAEVKLSGAAGALTGDPGAGESASALHLPLSVRAANAGTPVPQLDLGEFSLAQDLSFSHEEQHGPFAPLRLWPDGLPVRIGPHHMTFTEQQLSFTTDAVLGPPPYAFAPPAWHLDNKGIEIPCDPFKPDPADACMGSLAVTNAGFLDGPWQPAGTATVTIDGMSLDFDLPAGPALVYETLFPRGTWVLLRPPASLSVQDGRIADGAFAAGIAWLRRDALLCELMPVVRKFVLNGGALGPRIGIDGSLLAGVEDLNHDPGPTPLPVDWALHTATDLGCGTLYVPPLATAEDPQTTWHESSAPTVLGRGIYAGFNYNRDRVCRDSLGQPVGKTCTEDADCDTAQGETCVDGGFSPLCPAIDPLQQPTWNTVIDDVPRSFEIDPDEPGQGDREMAFVMRGSGVTGVFDGGDADFTIQNPGNPPTVPPGFEYEFTRYGLAYRQDRTEGADTIVSGGVKFPWPSLTEIPIPEMKVCSCGQPDGGRTPEALVKNTLLYWDADFLPYGVKLIDDPPSSQSCSALFGSGCNDANGEPNDTAVVQAITPIPRLKPDPESCFTLDTLGKPAEFTPISSPQLEFDESVSPALEPYRFDIDYFELSPHFGATKQQVVDQLSKPYGFYDLSGELEVPYFGMTPAGLRIQPQDRNAADGLGPTHFPVDLHEKGVVADSAVTVERVIAGNSVPVTYELDYFTPEVTADPGDGSDRVTANGNVLGRGKLFAFADEPAQSIGATKIAGAMIMTPEGGVHHGQADLGPAAAMRLWGATHPLWRLARLQTIMSPTLLQPASGTKYDAAIARLGYVAHDLPAPATLQQQLLETGAIDELADHPLEEIAFEVGDPALSPPVIGRRAVGHMDLDASQEQVESFEVVSDQSTGGRFYAFDASLLQVDRHVKDAGMPITTLGRADVAGARQSMLLPGEQDIPFPVGGGALEGGGSFFPGVQWDYDYDVDQSGPDPVFIFNSCTGTCDVKEGGMSGQFFDEMSATLGFYSNGDWYFDAGLRVRWSGYGGSGAILLGKTQDMTPLRKRAPDVASVLSGEDGIDGAFMQVGIRASLVDYGCMLTIGAGAEVAGWYFSQSFGGKVRGYIFGDGACLVTVHGDMTLLGAEVNDLFKFQGSFWVAGGLGFCDEEDWDMPSDVLDDDFCAACVLRLKMSGRFPPADLDLHFSGPKVSCSL